MEKCCFCKKSQQTKVSKDTNNMINIDCPECGEYMCSTSFYERCKQENFTKDVLKLIPSYLGSEEAEIDLNQSSPMELNNVIEKINSLKPLETIEQKVAHLTQYIERKLVVGESYCPVPKEICQAKNLGEYNIIMEKIEAEGIIKISSGGGFIRIR
jgi:hypothetical protein